MSLDNETIVQKYNDMCDIVIRLTSYCPIAMSDYVENTTEEGVNLEIGVIEHPDEIVKYEDEMRVLHKITGMMSHDLGKRKYHMGPLACGKCNDMWPKNRDKKIERKIGKIITDSGRDYDVLRDSVYFLCMTIRDDPNFLMIDKKGGKVRPVPNAQANNLREKVCTLDRYIMQNSDLESVYSILENFYDDISGRASQEMYERIRKFDNKKEIDHSLPLLKNILSTELSWMDCFEDMRAEIDVARDGVEDICPRKEDKAARGDVIKKEYKDHTRLLPTTIPKDELDTERVKFIRNSAKKYEEISSEGLGELVKLTEMDPEIVYYCIKDTRGSTTSREDDYFNK